MRHHHTPPRTTSSCLAPVLVTALALLATTGCSNNLLKPRGYRLVVADYGALPTTAVEQLLHPAGDRRHPCHVAAAPDGPQAAGAQRQGNYYFHVRELVVTRGGTTVPPTTAAAPTASAPPAPATQPTAAARADRVHLQLPSPDDLRGWLRRAMALTLQPRPFDEAFAPHRTVAVAHVGRWLAKSAPPPAAAVRPAPPSAAACTAAADCILVTSDEPGTKPLDEVAEKLCARLTAHPTVADRDLAVTVHWAVAPAAPPAATARPAAPAAPATTAARLAGRDTDSRALPTARPVAAPAPRPKVAMVTRPVSTPTPPAPGPRTPEPPPADVRPRVAAAVARAVDDATASLDHFDANDLRRGFDTVGTAVYALATEVRHQRCRGHEPRLQTACRRLTRGLHNISTNLPSPTVRRHFCTSYRGFADSASVVLAACGAAPLDFSWCGSPARLATAGGAP